MSDVAREDKLANDVFYVCSLIEFISRKTKNKKRDIIEKLGDKNLQKLLELADVYHSEAIENVADDFICNCEISDGEFDNVTDVHYAVPTVWDIGKVYKRLVLAIFREEKISLVEAMKKAYNSFVSDKIDNFNSSFFYENPQNIFLAYFENHV